MVLVPVLALWVCGWMQPSIGLSRSLLQERNQSLSKMVVLGQTGVKAETERHRGKDVWTDRSCSVVSHPEIDSPFFPLVGLPGQFLPFFTASFLQLQVAALCWAIRSSGSTFGWHKYHSHDHTHGTLGLQLFILNLKKYSKNTNSSNVSLIAP